MTRRLVGKAFRLVGRYATWNAERHKRRLDEWNRAEEFWWTRADRLDPR